MEQRLTTVQTALIVVLVAHEDTYWGVNEVAELSTGSVVIQPANGIKRQSRLEMDAAAENRIAVETSHHEQRLNATHRTPREPDALGVNLRPRRQQMVSAGNIRQVIAETLGAAGCS